MNPEPRTAVILVIGDEILSGDVRDENSGFLAAELSGLGITVAEIRVVPDRREAIVAALRELSRGDDLVLVSGGIGPTHDDLTRQAVAEVLGLPVRRHPEAERLLREGFGASVTEAELSMADLPEGAELLPGLHTNVQGFRLGRLHVLPGVPHLLRDIVARLAMEWSGQGLERVELLTHLREGQVADGLRRVQDDCPEVSIGSYPFRAPEGYQLRIVLRSADPAALERARRSVDALLAEAGAGG